jgi:hypothetical protein
MHEPWPYCERLGPEVFGEPWNTVTNAAFWVAGVIAWRQLAHRWRGVPWVRRWDVGLLVALLFAIGLGSALWHATAEPWAEMADVVPIGLFAAVYLGSYLARSFGLRPAAVALGLASFVAVNAIVQILVPRTVLNGSAGYAPMWLTIAAVAVAERLRGSPRARVMTLAFLLFSFSMVLRTIDRAVCDALSTGTHPFWHVTNAVLLALLVTALPRPLADD